MAIVDKFVVSILKTHQKYGAGDVVYLSQKEYDAYQADAPGQNRHAFRELVRLLYIEHPDGSRRQVDEDQRPTDVIVPADKVRTEVKIRSRIHELVRVEGLTRDDEEKLTAKVLADPKLDPAAFLADPTGYFQGRAQANRQAAGPARTR